MTITYKTLNATEVTESHIAEMKNAQIVDVMNATKWNTRKVNGVSIAHEHNILKMMYLNDNLAGAVLFTRRGKSANIDYVEVADSYKGEGYGALLINEIINDESFSILEGVVECSWGAYCFWSKIAEQLNQEIEVDEADLEYLNESDYDLDLDFYFNI